MKIALGRNELSGKRLETILNQNGGEYNYKALKSYFVPSLQADEQKLNGALRFLHGNREIFFNNLDTKLWHFKV